MGVARGCGGSRTSGGVYCVCPLVTGGEPIEKFLLDPPVVQDWKSLGVTPVGVKMIERNGVWHILDWVGSKYYPNVADFVEEVRRYGVSRRLSNRLDFSKLTPQSRIILLHSEAHIDNAWAYKREKDCPCKVSDHLDDNRPMCAGLWWEDVKGGQEQDSESRLVKRDMPAFSYVAKSTPEGVIPEYQLAAFASFPVWGLEVINDPDGKKHEKSLEYANKAKVEVHLVDE